MSGVYLKHLSYCVILDFMNVISKSGLTEPAQHLECFKKITGRKYGKEEYEKEYTQTTYKSEALKTLADNEGYENICRVLDNVGRKAFSCVDNGITTLQLCRMSTTNFQLSGQMMQEKTLLNPKLRKTVHNTVYGKKRSLLKRENLN